jgi:hypothetical protein
MIVHIVDGTYELFRYFFAVPSHLTEDNREVGGTRGVVGSMLSILEGGATHVGIATDHVIESFRNDLLASYKTGAGSIRAALAVHVARRHAVRCRILRVADGRVRADDAMGAAAKVAATDPRVERVMLCTPDKDLGQCVTEDGRIVQFDRRREALIDYAGVIAKFGVLPSSIPITSRSSATPPTASRVCRLGCEDRRSVLARYGHLEKIPLEAGKWDVGARRGKARSTRSPRITKTPCSTGASPRSRRTHRRSRRSTSSSGKVRARTAKKRFTPSTPTRTVDRIDRLLRPQAIVN